MTRQKQQAIDYMRKIGFDAKYINDFASNDTVYCFDSNNLNEVLPINDFIKKWVKEIEETRECLVYAVTHELMFFGECYSFLLVSKYEEDWPLSVRGQNDKYGDLAFVLNVREEWRSESGYVYLVSYKGKISRIG